MSMTLVATNLCSFPPLQNPNSTSYFSILCSKTSIVAPVSSYNGLKHLVLWKIAHKSFIAKEKKRRSKGKVVYASLLGVGAPEALVVGVMALLVFGPKGLAEVARSLGKTLRTFQPTIRELQDVSREFKSTLEKEIGLDDVSFTSQNTYRSNMTNTSSTQESTTNTHNFRPVVDINEDGASRSKAYGNITEEQPMFSASQQQGQSLPSDDKQPQSQPQPPVHSSSDVSIKSLVPPLLAVLLAVSPMVNTPVGQAIELQRGASLFSRACIGCHDTGGNIIQPGATLFLKDLIRNGVDTEEEIYRVTYNGKGRMPGFGESCTPRGQCTFGPRLKDEDIKLLAEFVKLQADQGWPAVETYGD